MLAILNSNLRRGVVSRAGAAMAGVCALAVVLPLAAMRPAPQESTKAPAQITDDMIGSSDQVRLRVMAQEQMAAHQVENATKLYERAVEVAQQKSGERSPEYAKALIDLAGAYRMTKGKWDKAIALYQQALPIQEATLGPDHPDVATTLVYLARDAASRAKHAPGNQNALPLYQRALDIRMKAFGPTDTRVAEILVAMAKLSDEEPAYRQALAAADAAGPTSSLTATALENYAAWLTNHDVAAEAGPMTTRAKEIRTTRVAEIGQRHGPAPGATRAMKVGSGVTAPRLLYKMEPEYTEEARTEKVQGTVLLYIEVGTDGLAHNVQLRKGVGSGLDEKAAEAVTQWKFAPGTKDGQPVTVAATVEVNFRLL